MAPVVRELDRRTEAYEHTVCVTAQHREMLDQVLDLFDIQPDIDLDLMKPGQDLTDVTSRILLGMRDVMADVQPDIVLVHGDTTTTFAASLAAFYAQVPVGHIEAGLRTGDPYQPWPEELNRKLTDALSALYFAPTERSRQNLLAESIADENIAVTGNTVIDALLWVRQKLCEDNVSAESINELLSRNSDQSAPPKALVDFLGEDTGADNLARPLVLVTGHRRENFGGGFDQIVSGIQRLATRYAQARFVYPVHLNPNVQETVYEALSGLDNVDLISPLDYEPFVYLMDRSTLVLTDSGGIQEEAPSLGKPVLVMRETTERPEALEAGTARLVGADAERIVNEVSRLLDNDDVYETMAGAKNPFGDGTAARQIVERLQGFEPHNSQGNGK